MAKLLGPDFINLLVRDVSASRAFYVGTLGLPVDPRFDTADVVYYECQPVASCWYSPGGAEISARRIVLRFAKVGSW